MKNITNKTKTILFASLIAAMILPFSAMDFAEASRLGQLTYYEVGILESTPSLQGISDGERDEFIFKLRAQINSLTGYEKHVFMMLNELAQVQKEHDIAKSQNETDDILRELQQKVDTKLFSMEEIGITTQDRWDASPEYWKNKVIDAKKSIETPETNNVSGNNGESEIYLVDQTDLALYRGAFLTYTCWDNGVKLPCPATATGWNDGKSTAEWWWVPTDGEVTYESSVCLDSDTHHNDVTFDMQTKRDIKSILQTWVYTYDNTVSTTLTGEAGECSSNFYKRSVSAGSSIGITTGISGISLN